MKAEKGNWVRIKNIILESKDRASNLPEDTKKRDLFMYSKGFLLNESAQVGEEVEIETYTGRNTKGILVEVNPYFTLDYGSFIPELIAIGKNLREELKDER